MPSELVFVRVSAVLYNNVGCVYRQHGPSWANGRCQPPQLEVAALAWHPSVRHLNGQVPSWASGRCQPPQLQVVAPACQAGAGLVVAWPKPLAASGVCAVL
jgi:hypothetical protein